MHRPRLVTSRGYSSDTESDDDILHKFETRPMPPMALQSVVVALPNTAAPMVVVPGLLYILAKKSPITPSSVSLQYVMSLVTGDVALFELQGSLAQLLDLSTNSVYWPELYAAIHDSLLDVAPALLGDEFSNDALPPALAISVINPATAKPGSFTLTAPRFVAAIAPERTPVADTSHTALLEAMYPVAPTMQGRPVFIFEQWDEPKDRGLMRLYIEDDLPLYIWTVENIALPQDIRESLLEYLSCDFPAWRYSIRNYTPQPYSVVFVPRLSEPAERTVYDRELRELGKKLESWEASEALDVFALDRLTNGGALLAIAYEILVRKLRFSRLLKFEDTTLLEVILTFIAHTRPHPYHNTVHAADVLRALYTILAVTGLTDRVGPFNTIFACCATLIMHLDHPGPSHQFHTHNASFMSFQSGKMAPISHHHLRASIEIGNRLDCNLLFRLPDDLRETATKLIVRFAVDSAMERHPYTVALWKRTMVAGEPSDEELLVMALKAARLSNAYAPISRHLQWVARLFEARFAAGDVQKELGLSVDYFSDRDHPDHANSEVSWLTYTVLPFLKAFREARPEIQKAIDRCEANRQHWMRCATH
eukprot:TRINITY_DN14336_c0_g1_i1.p1 TRINITY_DN14336_c0_g1~~TRINITY_DN14336_c0_g1_i1.p1  ORF type:complete len:602 (+),score=83.53 TRINITY_DN14336_c0_g1_i1:27-1808(+)